MHGSLRVIGSLAVAAVFALLWLSPPPSSRVARHQLPKLMDVWLEKWEEDLQALGQSRKEAGYETRQQIPAKLREDPGAEKQLAIRYALDGTRALFAAPTIVHPEGALDDEEKQRWSAVLSEWAKSQATMQIGPVGHELRVHYLPEAGLLRVDTPEHYPTTYDGKGARIATPVTEQSIPGPMSLAPPFLVLLVALWSGKTILSLAAGVLFGVWMLRGFLEGPRLFVQEYLLEKTLLDDDTFHIEVLGFVLLLSAAIGVMTKSGGLEGLVDLVKRFARTARSSQLATWFMGLLVFFDDYANTIVVGSTMRPLTDRLRVSREKLAYLVDSTAAPIAGLVPLSTWVAYEISCFAPQLPTVKTPEGQAMEVSQGFGVFLQTLPFRFYCFLTLFFVVSTVLLRREFGPMLAAERRARHEGKVIADDAEPLVGKRLTAAQPKDGVPRKAVHALVPIGSLVLVTFLAIAWTGWPAAENAPEGTMAFVQHVFAEADSALAILLGSASALLLACLLPIFDRISEPVETLRTAWNSMWALSFAVVILLLAWSIGYVCDDLGTKFFLVGLTEGNIAPALLPTVLFLVSCLIAFSTGSSWTTMAILLPNVVLVSYQLGGASEIGGMLLMVLSIGAVLEGSIFGDHCSPISDTTVLSSVASASDHLHHVRTQAPYALLVMAVSIVCGYLPVALLSPDAWPISMLLGATTLIVVLKFFGRDPEKASAA